MPCLIVANSTVADVSRLAKFTATNSYLCTAFRFVPARWKSPWQVRKARRVFSKKAWGFVAAFAVMRGSGFLFFRIFVYICSTGAHIGPVFAV